ncbi:serine hydrolase [Chitinophaga sp. SYP-B3965]|uniref:serine hydrolase domain-containing protein n=1 Tax=Chitinophaga sp. SYP-B3965 TaxID=2663120 RepID=UPI001299CD74|nr:serine hydrolase domain-containing protein [Chitinophaga sp. SYP-B3965]MRG47385.1 serine hydrolase [Chitinophaga sp. SYP-B3965]
MRYTVTLLLLFLTISCFSQQKYSADIEEKIRQVENNLGSWVTFDNAPVSLNLQERLLHYKVPGISIAVIRNYQLEWARGYGFADVEEKRPVTTQTLFQAASISKSLNAVGVLKLVEQNKLSLDADINTYLKSWHPSADSGKITIANLLSHTAGLTVHGFRGYETKDTLPSVVQILQGKKPANSPEVKPAFASGLRFQYSGGGTTISQLIVTEQTGRPYDQYQQQEVLNPMGMTGSFYTQPAPASKKDLLATAYHQDGKPVEGKYHVYPEMGAAGLWTNPVDLSKYIIETQLASEGKSSKVLSQAMTKKRLTPYIDKSAGLGVFIFENKWFNHNGGNEGFRCVYYGSLEGGNGLVVMVNSDNYDVISEVVRSIGKTYGWNEFNKSTVKTLADVPVDTLKQYAGIYKFQDITLTVTQQGNHLFIRQDQGNTMRMYFTSGKDFVLTEVPAEARFEQGNLLVKQGNQELRFLKQ